MREKVTWLKSGVVTLFNGNENRLRFDIRLVRVIDWLVAGHGHCRIHTLDNALHVRVARDHYAGHVGRGPESRGRQDTVFDLRQPQVLSHFTLGASRALVLCRLRVVLVVTLSRVLGLGGAVPAGA